MPRLPRIKVRIPNTRAGAFLVAGGLALLGSLLGVALLVVVPAARAGQGPFAFFFRGAKQVNDLRTRQVQQQTVGINPNRPEAWQTPTATFSFPSDDVFNRVHQAGSTVTYVPARGERILPVPTIHDAVGRSLVSAVVALGSEQGAATPEALRPELVDPTELTVAASAAGDPQLAGCVLAMRAGVLQAVGAFGTGSVGDCQSGHLALANGQGLDFGVSFDQLPNVQTRDGAWREGGVIGRAQVSVALSAAEG